MIFPLPNPARTLGGRVVAATLVAALAAGSALAGVTVTGSDGVRMTGADGVTYSNTSGIVMTGADGLLAFQANGIRMTGADGVAPPGADGVRMTGADAATFAGGDSVAATRADGLTLAFVDGIRMTGADGIRMTGADGSTYTADSVVVRSANAVVMTGADGIRMTGADGIVMTGADGVRMTGADGIVMTGADGIRMTGADSLVATRPDGSLFSVEPSGIVMAGVDGVAASYAQGIVMTGADGIRMMGADGAISGEDVATPGLESFDPQLAATLDALTDDSSVDAVVVYHALPTDADVADLVALGIVGGLRFRALPMIAVTTTRERLLAVSHLPTVRSIYGQRTLDLTADHSRATTGVERARADADLAGALGGAPNGDGVTVAVLDTGVDATHPDLAGRVVQNVKLLDTQSLGPGFVAPVNLENVPNTDTLQGHGTFVAGIVAGTGARSGGKFRGVAPGARVLGLGAGDLALVNVLAGFDYLLDRGAQYGVRVVNCSFSANVAFDVNDPVNVATWMLAERGVDVVFSAGNAGPGWNTMNPYAAAPWVISVGATDDASRLACFSSRGDFGSATFRPTLVAPGVSIVSLRGANVTGVTGAIGTECGASPTAFAPSEAPFYTTASGTSFSAPQVAGAVALVLEANPSLSPAAVRDLLQRTATPLPPYYRHEVGAGMLNAHAAALEAAFPARRMGAFRSTLDRGQARFVEDPAVAFSGTVAPGSTAEVPLAIPANVALASVAIAWGPLLTANDLALAARDPGGATRASSDALNLPGITGRTERVTLASPAAGTWRARVSSSLPVMTGPQPFVGSLEVARVEYAPAEDLASLAPAARADALAAMRAFVMAPVGNRFRPTGLVSRVDLAAAMLACGRVPQYLPSRSEFADVRDRATLLAAESAQRAPGGPLFADAPLGGQFRPDAAATRIAAAVVLVRAAGYQAEAEARAGCVLTVVDALTVPAELRGYVAVALERGLLLPDASSFRPAAPLTRIDLAHAAAALMALATK